jgi:hypothetical protein
MMTMTTPSRTSRAGCSCPDFGFHGSQITAARLSGLRDRAGHVQISGAVGTGGRSGEFLAQTIGGDDQYSVVISEDGPINMLCKHVLAAFWFLKVPVFVVEYDDPDWPDATQLEVRTEAFWGNESAVAAIMSDGEVVSVKELTPITQLTLEEGKEQT